MGFSVLLLLSALIFGYGRTVDFYTIRSGAKTCLVDGLSGEYAEYKMTQSLYDQFDKYRPLSWIVESSVMDSGNMSWTDGRLNIIGINTTLRAKKRIHRTNQFPYVIHVALGGSDCDPLTSPFFAISQSGNITNVDELQAPSDFIARWTCEGAYSTISFFTTDGNVKQCDTTSNHEVTMVFEGDGNLTLSQVENCTGAEVNESIGIGSHSFLYIGTINYGDNATTTHFDKFHVSTLLPQKPMLFNDIQVPDDMLQWLRGHFSQQMFNSDSALRQQYTPVGYMEARTQKVGERQCPRTHIPFDLSRICYHVNVDPSTHHVKDLAKASDFEGTTTDLESIGLSFEAASNPVVWQPDTVAHIDTYGYVQHSYDGSGYTFQFNMTDPSLTSDAAKYFQSEAGPDLLCRPTCEQTRMHVIEIVLANYNLGGFVTAVFLFEFTPSGGVVPSFSMYPFKTTKTWGDDVALVLDIFRWVIIVLYMGFARVYSETLRKKQSERSSISYVVSFGGIVDASIVALFLAIQTQRHRSRPPEPYLLTKFFSYSYVAFYQTEMLEIAEACFVFLLLLRLATLSKINPHAYRFFRMYARSAAMFSSFMAIFLPVFFGLTFLVHAIWSPQLDVVSTWFNAAVSLFLGRRQSFDVVAMYEKNPGWTPAFLIYYFFSLNGFLFNVFLAILVYAYWEVELMDSSTVEETRWTNEQYIDWMLLPSVYKLVRPHEPGRSRKLGFDDGDSEDSDDSDDEDEQDAKR